ncbi:MAG: hypothetical protein LC632_07755 [Xanthomonadaceae bacterium]|nr:hypothetical protein [Xanthomonadaceae bacterium]
MTRRRRWTIVALLLLVLALPLALLTSETALRFVADAVSQRVTALEIKNLRGTLLTSVSADRVTWRDETRATVTVSGLSTRLRILPALVGRLHFDRLEAASVTVALAPTRPPPPDTPQPRTIRLPAKIEIPLVIRIRELAVGVVMIERAGHTLFEVESVDGADLYAGPNSFRIGRLAAAGDPASFEVSGGVEPVGAWRTTLESRWRVHLPNRPRFDATLSFDGALDGTLTVAAHAESEDAGTARFAGTMRGLLSDPSVEGQLVADGVVVRRWAEAAPEARVSVDLALDGWLRDLGVLGTASVETPDWPSAEIDAEVHWGQQLFAVRRAAVRSGEVATTVEAVGHIDWSAADPTGNLRASWRALRWPLTDPDGLRSDDGTLALDFADGTARAEADAQFGEHDAGRARARADLQWLAPETQPRVDASVEWTHLLLAGVDSDHGRASVQGTLDDWAGAVVATVATQGMPMLTLSADATGDQESMRASDVHADWLDGAVDGTVTLSWADGLRGDAALVLADINLGTIRSDWAGRIGGRVQASVATEHGRTRWQARLRDGTGRVGERAFNARAELAGVAADLQRIDAAVQLGDAEATVRGVWTPEIEVAWSVSTPDLGVLIPGARGALQGEGYLRGDPDAPAFGFEVTGDALRFGGVSVASLSGNGEVDLAGTRGTNAVLSVEALDFDGRTVDSAELTVSGPPTALTVGLDAYADALHLRARVAGAWNDDAFVGRLTIAELVEAGDTPWQLAAPAAVRAGSDAFQLGNACWRQPGTPNELCVAGGWRAGVDTRFQATLTGLPMAELSEWLPLGFQYSGRISGNASLVWPAGGQPTAEGQLRVTEGANRHAR